MNRAQAVLLKALAQQAYEPEAFNPRLTAAQASLRIQALWAKLRLQDEPPHVL